MRGTTLVRIGHRSEITVLRDIAREAGNFARVFMRETSTTFDLPTLRHSERQARRLSSFKATPYISDDGTAAAAASYHDQPAVELNSGVCTRHILKEGSIDVSNWESFLHCRAYGSRENGVLIKARINIEIK